VHEITTAVVDVIVAVGTYRQGGVRTHPEVAALLVPLLASTLGGFLGRKRVVGTDPEVAARRRGQDAVEEVGHLWCIKGKQEL